MEIEEIKELWNERNRQLEASLRLNTALLTELKLRKSGSRLGWLTLGIAIELILNVAAVVLIGAFIAANLHELRFLAPAVLLDAYAIAIVVAQGRQLAEIAGVDYDAPVVAIQAKLEGFRAARIRTTLATLLFAPLMWVPLLIVGTRALGIDIYAAGWAWLASNAIFGIAVIPVAVAVARRYGERLARTTPMRALADAIAGRSLTMTLESLAAIRRFES